MRWCLVMAKHARGNDDSSRFLVVYGNPKFGVTLHGFAPSRVVLFRTMKYRQLVLLPLNRTITKPVQ